jgi:hypothetical protein
LKSGVKRGFYAGRNIEIANFFFLIKNIIQENKI